MRALALLTLLGCSAVVKTQYQAQKEACVTYSTSRAEADDCLRLVDRAWTEAGAPPAAPDAGSQ